MLMVYQRYQPVDWLITVVSVLIAATPSLAEKHIEETTGRCRDVLRQAVLYEVEEAAGDTSRQISNGYLVTTSEGFLTSIEAWRRLHGLTVRGVGKKKDGACCWLLKARLVLLERETPQRVSDRPARTQNAGRRLGGCPSDMWYLGFLKPFA
jgi:hypothetical protein